MPQMLHAKILMQSTEMFNSPTPLTNVFCLNDHVFEGKSKSPASAWICFSALASSPAQMLTSAQEQQEKLFTPGNSQTEFGT